MQYNSSAFVEIESLSDSAVLDSEIDLSMEVGGFLRGPVLSCNKLVEKVLHH